MGCLIETSLLTISFFILAIYKTVNKHAQPIFNIYQRSNGFYWLKVLFIYTILSIQKLLFKLKHLKKRTKFEEYDKPQALSSNPQAIDAVYFNGANGNGDYLVVGTARRKNKLVDGFLYVLVDESGLGLLETPKLPGTALYQHEKTTKYEAEGIEISPEIPMKSWKLKYEGKMKRHTNRDELVDVKLDATWNSNLPYFNFDTDMDPWCMARSMAYETFSRDYFENLKRNHQTHYEQHGTLKGIITINEQTFKIDIDTVRDHSFGQKREWRNFHRYCLHFLSAENGDRFHIGKICLPICFSRLTIGYVYSAQDKKIYPLTSCDLEMYQHGEDGIPPLDYAFSFKAGGRLYHMEVNVRHSPHFYISKDWECKVVESLCTFKINGIKGWGAAEWQYRNIDEKNVPDYDGS